MLLLTTSVSHFERSQFLHFDICFAEPGGMHLVNTFEEEFVEDTWCKLSKQVASDTSRSVVSLASFKGDHYILFPYICLFLYFIADYHCNKIFVEDQRFFCCTGVVIDCIRSTSRILTSASLIRSSPDENNIADNLKVGTTYNYVLSFC